MSSLFFAKNSSMSLLTDSLCFIKNRLEKSVWKKEPLKCTAPVYIFWFCLQAPKQNSKSCHNFLFCYLEKKELMVMNFFAVN